MQFDQYFTSITDRSLLLVASYDPWLVALSLLIAVVASGLGLGVVEFARMSVDPLQRRLAVASGAVALGIGVWAMHFLGMLALRLCAPVEYDPRITALSVLPSLFASWVALRLLVVGEISNRQLLVGGVLVGVGIGAMHYSGMQAMQMAPLLRYQPGWFVLSIIVAIALAMVALWIRYSQVTARYRFRQRVLISAAVMGAAISGMHYTAMKAAVFIGSPTSPLPLAPNGMVGLSVAISVATLLLGLAVLGVNAFFRYREMAHVAEQARAQIAAVVDHLGDALVTFEANGGIRSVNPAVRRLLGYMPEELIGQSMAKLLPEYFAGRDAAARAGDWIGPGGAQVSTEAWRKDGSRLPVSVALNVFPSGEQRCFVATLRDISEQQRLIDAERAKQAAEAANRAKSELLASMSHELRTPLAAILGYAEEALRDDAPRGSWLDALQRIARNGRHLLGIVNDVLDAGKIDAGQLRVECVALSPAASVQEVVDFLSERAGEKGVTLRAEYQWPLPAALHADPLRLRQVLINVIGNAIKFTDSGSVTVQARLASPACLEIAVTDTGIGLTAEQKERIFRPFEQGDLSISRRYGGSGLGLYISSKLVEAMHGRIEVHSRPGAGSTFVLSFPVAAGMPLVDGMPSQAETARQSQAPALRGHVLVVDDVADLRMLIAQMVASTGVHVSQAEHGQQAIDMVAAQPFDLILMDMHMPMLDGQAATLRLRELGCQLPIIALTADALPENVSRFLQAGCNAVLAKPIDRAALYAVLQTYLAEAGPEPAVAATGAAATTREPPLETALAEVRQRFLAQLPGEAQQLRQAIDAAAWDDVRVRLHRLKGSAGTFGFARLSVLAQQAEHALREAPEALPQALAQLLAALRSETRGGAS